MVHGLAVQNTFGARRIVSDHAPYIGPTASCGIGCKMQAVWLQFRVQIIPGPSRLYPYPFFRTVYFKNGIHVLGKIQDHGLPHCLSGQTCTCAPWKNGDVVLWATETAAFTSSVSLGKITAIGFI